MLDSARRPARWAAAIALTAVAALAPVTATTTADAASLDACGTTLLKAGGGQWACTFVDGFDGKALDRTKWITQDSSYSGFTVGGECYSKDKNIAVRSGQLVLSATKARSSFACRTPAGAYQTKYMGAAVSTQTKFSQTYGRFEARLKFSNTTAGLHAGYWMNPEELFYGEWPYSGEIDVAEYYSSVPNYVFPSLHYSGETGADTGWWTCPVVDVTQFHTYAVEWSSTRFDFIYDGKVCFSRVADSDLGSTTAPFDRPFFHALTAAVGGGPNAPTSSSSFPATVTVDYVKSWK